jgi:hypothetical protein
MGISQHDLKAIEMISIILLEQTLVASFEDLKEMKKRAMLQLVNR